MSLRLKIVLALTLLAAAATAAIGVVSYNSTRNELLEVVDDSLDDAARRITAQRGQLNPGDFDDDGPPGPRGGFDRPRSFEQVLVQALDADGLPVLVPSSGALPVSDADLAVVNSTRTDASVRHDVEIDGESYRMLTVKFGSGAVQLARSVREAEQSLSRILRSTLLGVMIVAVVSAMLGWLIGRRVTRRLEHLTTAAGLVAGTGRLDIAVPVDGADETGQLGRAFSRMLDALHRSRQEQQQLVQDAGHELRTPLTSLRTNISVLRRFDSLPVDSRSQLLADLDSETRELSELVDELVELATERRDDEPLQRVVLGDVAERAAERGRRRFGREIVVVHDGSSLDGRANALERAVQNLVDNACKFAPDGPVHVTVDRGTVTVRDHGPGLVDADIPRLFDRFFRSVAMRSRPGSGLGLSIVKSVVESHGGTVFARNAAEGGAELGFTVPTSR